MRAQGVNRVTIGVKDTDRLDEAVEFYSKLLGATFYDQSIPAEPFNLKCFIGWDAGMELVAPLPGRWSDVKLQKFWRQMANRLRLLGEDRRWVLDYPSR